MKRLLIIFILGWAWAAWPGEVAAQSPGCCISPGETCLDNYFEIQCGTMYPMGIPAGRFSPGTTCATVALCQETGKCQKIGNSGDCTNGTRLACNQRNDSSYVFYVGQTCGAAAAVGTCCVEPSPPMGRPTCLDNKTSSECSAMLWTYHAQACSTLPNCNQASGTGTAPNTSTPTVTLPELKFEPEVPLPNFVGGTISAASMAEYIRAVFVLFIWVVGIMAGVMIIWGGIKWVGAAGNAGRINDARDVVNNAIIGLILALVSVVLLTIINPNLTRFPGLTINSAPRIPFESDIATGKFNEAFDCKSNGRPVASEAQCFISGLNLSWPVGNVAHAITSSIGPREPGGVGSKCHAGTDISTNRVTRTPLIATHDGTIQLVGRGCGEETIELAGNGFYVRYFHVKSSNVASGEKIKAGQVIGFSGGDPKDGSAIASCSQAPHLHIELYGTDKSLHDIAPCLGD